MPSTLQQLQDLIDAVEAPTTEVLERLRGALEDADKFDQGNSAAGTRVRNAVLEARRLLPPLRKTLLDADGQLHEVRGSIQQIKKSRQG